MRILVASLSSHTLFDSCRTPPTEPVSDWNTVSYHLCWFPNGISDTINTTPPSHPIKPVPNEPVVDDGGRQRQGRDDDDDDNDDDDDRPKRVTAIQLGCAPSLTGFVDSTASSLSMGIAKRRPFEVPADIGIDVEMSMFDRKKPPVMQTKPSTVSIP